MGVHRVTRQRLKKGSHSGQMLLACHKTICKCICIRQAKTTYVASAVRLQFVTLVTKMVMMMMMMMTTTMMLMLLFLMMMIVMMISLGAYKGSACHFSYKHKKMERKQAKKREQRNKACGGQCTSHVADFLPHSDTHKERMGKPMKEREGMKDQTQKLHDGLTDNTRQPEIQTSLRTDAHPKNTKQNIL